MAKGIWIERRLEAFIEVRSLLQWRGSIFGPPKSEGKRYNGATPSLSTLTLHDGLLRCVSQYSRPRSHCWIASACSNCRTWRRCSVLWANGVPLMITIGLVQCLWRCRWLVVAGNAGNVVVFARRLLNCDSTVYSQHNQRHCCTDMPSDGDVFVQLRTW